MMNEGPDVRFMTDVVVIFRNVTLHFDIYLHAANFLDKINDLLVPVGAKASGDRFHTLLELCDGQRIKIVQKRVDKFFFLNVDFNVAGCHEEFQGVLGQLYRCK